MPNLYFGTTNEQTSGLFALTLGAAPGSTYLAQAAVLTPIAIATALINATGATTISALATIIQTNLGIPLTDTAATNTIKSYLGNSVATAGQGLVSFLAAAVAVASPSNVLYATYGTYANNLIGTLETGLAYSLIATNNSTNVATLQAAVGSANAVVGSTFTLTTGVDTFTPGPNSVINGILGTGATINSFDSVVAAGQNDVFNIVDNTTVNFALPTSITLSGLTTVNLARQSISTGNVTVTNTTFGTGLQAFNLTDANTGASGTVSVTLNSATSVSAVNTGTFGFGAVTITDTSATAALTGSTLTTVTVKGASNTTSAITLNGNAISTVNLASDTGLTTINAAAGTRALTINASGTTNQGGLTDATATSVTLNETSAATFGTLTTAKATSVTVNTTGTATTAGAETITAALATSLTFGGTRATTATLTGDVALTSVVIAGSGGVTVDVSGSAAVTSVNTSAATNVASATGAANLTTANVITLGNAQAFTGGAGTDTINVGATTQAITFGSGKGTANVSVTALGTGGSITGSGTDTLGLSAANATTLSTAGAVQTAFKTAVTGFNTLTLAAFAASSTVDTQGFGSFGTVNLTGNILYTETLANLASGSTVNLTGPNTGLTTSGTLGANLTDTLNINLKDAAGGIAAFGTITTPNLGTLVITNTDTQATPVGYLDTATIVDSSLRSLTLSGNSGLSVTLTGDTSLTTVNAAGITKVGVTLTTAALQYASTITGSTGATNDTIDAHLATAAVTIIDTASTGTDALTGSALAGNTINAGTGTLAIVANNSVGVDNISIAAGNIHNNSVAFGGTATTGTYNVTIGAHNAGVNTITVANAGTSFATAPNTVITGAQAGDTITFGNDSGATGAAQVIAAQATLALTIGALETASAANFHGVFVSVFGGNTYVAESLLLNSSATNTTLIELVGTHTLGTAATGSVALTS